MVTSLDKNILGSRDLGNHGNNHFRHTREVSSSSVSLFEVQDTLKKPLYGILMKAPFFDDKKYEKVCYEVSEGGAVKKWTMKMFKFDSETGVLCYCDAGSYQKSNQIAAEVPTVMLGKCQYFHVGTGAVCNSVPDMDNVDKCQFVFRLEGLTGVQNKTLYLASYTPEDRLKWVTRITGYSQTQQLNRVKLREHQRLKVTISTQDVQIKNLSAEVEDLIQLSGYLKGQVKKYQTLSGQMREDNSMLLDKLEVVSKEITGLRNSLKQNSVSNQIKRLTIEREGESDNEENEEYVSPEVEYLEKFSKYLDFKRNDIIRLSKRSNVAHANGNVPREDRNVGEKSSRNDFSRKEEVV